MRINCAKYMVVVVKRGPREFNWSRNSGVMNFKYGQVRWV